MGITINGGHFNGNSVIINGLIVGGGNFFDGDPKSIDEKKSTSENGISRITVNSNCVNVQMNVADTNTIDAHLFGHVTTDGTTEETTIPEGFNTVPENFDYTVNVSNFSQLKSALSDCAKKSGQKAIYITDDIDATEQIKLSTSNANISLIGLEKADGSYPAIDFAKFRDSKNSTGENGTGIYVSKGSYYNFKNLIVKNAPDCGMRIKNSNSGNCIIQNCVFKYNNNSGISVTAGGHDNTFIGVDSYRNCDLVQKLGSDADGFSVKLNAGKNNKFFACRAWENGDDGWDSFDKTTSGYTKDLSYEECACWNNGNPNIFTGKYDYENGNALDTNLYLVELISKQDKNFVSNYNKGNFSLPTDSFINTSAGKINLSSWTGSNYDGNPNGFKFGSAYTDKTSLRTVKNCLSFGHGRKGFDNNNSTVKASFENCVSFDNGYNYYFPTFSVSKASDMLGFNGKSKDKVPSSVSVTTPTDSAQKSIRSKVESTRKSIVSQCNSNVIPGEVYFNIY